MPDSKFKIVDDPLQRRDPEATSPEERERDYRNRRFGFLTVIALFISGILTYLLLIGATPIRPTGYVVLAAIIINSVLAGILVYLILVEVVRLVNYRRRGRAAARLHIRIIGLFSLAAAVPAILVALVAAITLDQGLDRWFEGRTKAIVKSSVSIAQAYMNESTRVLMASTISMASELDGKQTLFRLDRTGFRNLFTLHAKARGLTGAWLINKDRKIIASADIPSSRQLPMVNSEVVKAADSGDPIQIPPSGTTNLVGAVFKLRTMENTYLYTIITVQPAVLNALNETVINSAQYQGLEQNRLPFQIAYAVLYTSIVLIVLLAAIWTGISVADRLVAPIRRLIGAADEVRGGNLNVAVSTRHAEGDLRDLSDTFNTMVLELKNQHQELSQARDTMDQRARFTEAVLAGVSGGVLGVDKNGNVTIANLSAIPLLGLPEGINQNSRPLSEVSPELASVLEKASKSGKNYYHEQATTLVQGRERTLSINVTREDEVASENSFVLSVDDITDLVSAQRSTAWGDIARRIAHEIKNPLTPIQLSAERIRRRYGKHIVEDREVFDKCVDTIIRQVGDIGSMVDEFSSFARMPKPTMEVNDLRDVVRESVFMQSVGNPEIEYSSSLGDDPLIVSHDNRLISQALINIIKNAAEAIEAHEYEHGEKGKIVVNAKSENGSAKIDIIDNGKGLPNENRQQLLEPYMTTRQKGTGLGLAIVRKIMEDHGGTIELMDAPQVADGGHGAMMRLVIPLDSSDKNDNGSQSTEYPKGHDEQESSVLEA